MQVVGRQDLDDERVEVRSAGYRSFWGNYRWSSQVAFSPGRSHGPQAWVETRVHSLDPDALLWSGRSRTADPGEAAALFGEVGRAAAAEMEKAGLLDPGAAVTPERASSKATRRRWAAPLMGA